MLVFSVTALLPGWVSVAVPAVAGTVAPKVIVPCTELRRCAVKLTSAPAASAGTGQETVAGPVAGRGAQPVMAPVAASSTVPEGTVRLSEVAGAALKPSLVMRIE